MERMLPEASCPSLDPHSMANFITWHGATLSLRPSPYGAAVMEHRAFPHLREGKRPTHRLFGSIAAPAPGVLHQSHNRRSLCHQSKEEGMKPSILFERGVRLRELQKYIVPEYAELAFNLPPASGSFWGLMEDEIDRLVSEDTQPFSKDINQSLAFLARFFSTSLLDTIASNLDALDQSFLGIEYTLREGKAMVAMNVLRDIQEVSDVEGSPLHNFFGHVDVSSDDEDVHDRDEMHAEKCEDFLVESGIANSGGRGGGRGGSRGGRAGHGAGRGRGRGAGSGRDLGTSQGRGETFPEQHFKNLDEKCIVVPLPSFSTPPHGDPGRHRTLKLRSWQFVSHDRVKDQVEKLYNPHNCQSGKVFVYHGTRSSSLSQFKLRGIDPPLRRNEFSRDVAFYVSNSIRRAYEHPLHYHPARHVADPISVMVFELNVAVLHGLEAPAGDPSPFTVLWFPDTKEETPAWQEFCKGNFRGTARRHVYDIVIGPVCLPRDDGDWAKLQIGMPYDTPLTQIAFCSSRAREWLGQSFKAVYLESFVAQE